MAGQFLQGVDANPTLDADVVGRLDGSTEGFDAPGDWLDGQR
jgi:hypothetical protein